MKPLNFSEWMRKLWEKARTMTDEEWNDYMERTFWSKLRRADEPPRYKIVHPRDLEENHGKCEDSLD